MASIYGKFSIVIAVSYLMHFEPFFPILFSASSEFGHFSILLFGFMDCFLCLNIGILLTAVIFWLTTNLNKDK
ncbi:hypothetical protein BpHYR1_027410 [Brachionus plicatilis]|uniref:Uncharacterized protein n=1 Tax=Brachionus plicatilis TaxID=10195 RepID=A0A3M7QWM1_BRAPC|nr:hypothetical protein BpHYR1_027410 [Brachionus plicatilis]